MKLIKKSEIPPGARLELRWHRDTQRVICEYILLIPIDAEKDIRTHDNNYEEGMLRFVLGTTIIEKWGWLDTPLLIPIMPDGSVELPKRDGKHALWDSEYLGNLPVWVTWEDQAMLVDESKVAVTKVNNRPMHPVRNADWDALGVLVATDEKTVEVDRVLLKRLMYEIHELHVKLRTK